MEVQNQFTFVEAFESQLMTTEELWRIPLWYKPLFCIFCLNLQFVFKASRTPNNTNQMCNLLQTVQPSNNCASILGKRSYVFVVCPKLYHVGYNISHITNENRQTMDLEKLYIYSSSFFKPVNHIREIMVTQKIKLKGGHH